MEPLIILSGPTSVGKTELSLQLAKAVDGEIISADSMQVYRHMDIGTAKLPEDQRMGIPHHLIDCCNPDEEWDVTRFVSMAKDCIQGIRARNRIPIVVGGTGFYIQALLKDISFSEEDHDDGYRASLERIKDNDTLFQMLSEVDSESSQTIPKENRKRVIRALEYFHYHNEPISESNKRQKEQASPYKYAYFVLTMNREALYRRIEERVDDMVEQGLCDEIRALRDMGYTECTVAMQGLGYKQMIPYINEECTLDEAVAKIKLETRHFAKRQMTWFRREPDVIMLSKDDNNTEQLLNTILTELKIRDILEGTDK